MDAAASAAEETAEAAAAELEAKELAGESKVLTPVRATTHDSFRGSFSAVSTPPIARVGAFFSIFRDLQDFHSFAPLRIQNFSKKRASFFHIFTEISQNFTKFRSKSIEFQRNFAGISPKFHRTNSEFRLVPKINSKFPIVRVFATISTSNAYGLQKNEATSSASALREIFGTSSASYDRRAVSVATANMLSGKSVI